MKNEEITNINEMNMNTEDIFKCVKDILLKNFNLHSIILFGSYARGRQKYNSDIDVAIKPTDKIQEQELINTKNEIEKIIGIDVHLINLDEINDDFRYEILLTGKTLYCKNEYELEMYKLKKYSDYLLFSEDRKVIVDKVKQGGTLYGEWIGNI